MSNTLQAKPTTPRDILYLRLSVVLFIVISATALLTFQDYGVSWDEGLQRHMGETVFRFYTSFMQDRSALDMGDLNNYGGFFEILGEIASRILPFGVYESRHLLSAIAGILGILAVWKIARFLSGPGAAFWTAVLLSLYPPYYGHMFINSKDIPFAALYAWSLYFLIQVLQELPGVTWKTAGKLALASGLTMATRVGGLIVLCYLGLFAGLWFLYILVFRRDWFRSSSPVLIRSSAIIAMVPVVAYTIMLAFWPYGMSKPFVKPFVALQWLSHVTKEVSSWDYIPRHLVYKLPELVLLLLPLGLCIGIYSLISAARADKRIVVMPYLVLAFSVLFPVCYAIRVKPYLYDEIRHFLFIIPPLICLAAITLNWCLELLFKKAVLGRIAVGGLIVYLCLQVRVMSSLHPYEYVYFNRLIGGIEGATKNGYEAEYWGTSYKEGVKELQSYLRRRDGDSFDRTPYKIMLGNAEWCATYYFPPNFIPVTDPLQANIYLSTTRWGGAQTHSGAQVVTVSRMGVPFIVAKIMNGGSAGR